MFAPLSAAALATFGGSGCAATTDVTVPPTQVHPSFTIAVPDPLPTGRLPPLAQPKHYALALTVDPASDRFTGEVTIDVTLPNDTPVVVLNAADLQITHAEALVAEEKIPLEFKFRKAAGAVDVEEELVLIAPRALPAGSARLRLAYGAPLREGLTGLYRVKEGDAWYAFTQLEPTDARRLMPCFDDPAWKTPFDVTLTVPDGNAAFANAPEHDHASDGGRITVHFAPTPPMPTYLLALAVGPLEVREGPKGAVPLRLIAPKGKSALGGAALEVASASLKILADYFARPYPYDKLDLVAVPNFGAGAMENAGLVTFREEVVLLDPANTSAAAQRDMAATVSHELAHQWFGNLVTMKWWDDLWLNEGFATFMEVWVVDRYKPHLGAGIELISDRSRVMDLDALSSARAVRQPVKNVYEADEAFDGITYVKGASVLGMLQSWLGEQAFRTGIQSYLAGHEWGSATAEDLFDALGQASGKDVRSVASTFLDRPGVPIVRAELHCETPSAPRLALTQRRYTATARKEAGTDASPWHIPVCVDWGDGRTRTRGHDCGILSEASSTLSLSAKSCPEWVNPNADYQGYYRFALPPAELAALERATLAAGPAGLGGPANHGDVRARVGFLGNAWSLVAAGELGVERVLDSVLAQKGERDRHVVEEMIAILLHVSNELVEPEARDAFQSYASAILLPMAKRLGWDARPHESEDDRILRRNVLDALGMLTADPWLVREASNRTRAFLQKPASADADSAAIALRIAARAGDPEAKYEALLALLGDKTAPELRVNAVRALASFRDAKLFDRTLELVLAGTIRTQDAIYVMRSAMSWPDSRERFVEWLARHLGELAEKLPGFAVAHLITAVDSVCDEKRRAAVESAIRPEIAKLGFGARALAQALEHASLCIDLRARQASAASAYFAKRKW